jgi:hypothetical protein
MRREPERQERHVGVERAPEAKVGIPEGSQPRQSRRNDSFGCVLTPRAHLADRQPGPHGRRRNARAAHENERFADRVRRSLAEHRVEEAVVIPTMILFGLLFGRWWKVALVVGTSAWPVLLWAQGVIAAPPEIVGAAALGLVNTAVGVMAHQLVRALVRRARGHSPIPIEARR